MKRLLALLLSVMSGAALAQTTGTVNPSPAPAQPSANEDVPPGGCMPIGLTASGEIVFPIQCKEFIERYRGIAVEQKPAAVEENPAAVEEKAAAKQSEAVAPENSKPANKPAETVPLPKRVEHEPRKRAISLNDCTHYRTYDPASGTYRGYDGRRRSCDKWVHPDDER
jgi:BA14K-like protein